MTWYPHTVTVAAAFEPITTDALRLQARVDGEEDYLAVLVTAARAYVEAYTGTPLVTRTVTIKCDGFADFARFPVVPLGSVSGITYVDGAGAGQTLSTDVYEVRSDGLTASIALKSGQSWPTVQTGSRITVTAIVGYSAIPADIGHALKLIAGTWYDQRATVSEKQLAEVPHAAEFLLSNHRVFAA